MQLLPNETDPFVLNHEAFSISLSFDTDKKNIKRKLKEMLDLERRALKYSDDKRVPERLLAHSYSVVEGGDVWLIKDSTTPGEGNLLANVIAKNSEEIKVALLNMPRE